MTTSCRMASRFLHVKCRNTEQPYLRSDVFRFAVSDDKINWAQKFPQYEPIDYTANAVNGKSWADSSDPRSCRFNEVDGKINRKSYEGIYGIGRDGRPFNPFGRTGLRGRGALGRWGPNHAVDTIVSRFTTDGKLQFIGIERCDTDEWAIPGGIIDIGESTSEAHVREFAEEVLDNSREAVKQLAGFWVDAGHELYRGYVDDPRNTDNAWMETVAVNFHDTDNIFAEILLKAGDDAKNARWITIVPDLPLYASHERLIQLLLERHGVKL